VIVGSFFKKEIQSVFGIQASDKVVETRSKPTTLIQYSQKGNLEKTETYHNQKMSPVERLYRQPKQNHLQYKEPIQHGARTKKKNI
jgi:hypothetical protein